MTSPLADLRHKLQRIERGHDRWALRWQVLLATVDLAILAFFLLGPYLRTRPTYLIIDYGVALWIMAEMAARALAAPSLRVWISRALTWIDLVVLATLLFPDLLYNFAFLRVMRLWAVGDSPLLRQGLRRLGYGHLQDVAKAVLHFLVFLFVVTGFVYTSFFYDREGSEGFVDALYFTVATVTTTGFGDITLPGTLGKLTSVATMIIGISLFVRLAQAVVRPLKVQFPCPRCGLQRHDLDAVHCKACGEILNIPNDDG
ncbi:potassium channel protein [Neorhizobium lilium]|uniref:Potassium channel protein n=1 Tax=Neorhizobium lilium TaxID=2503024 RepID=A0A444LEB5_9HYPH|nr:potassium channel family protein [Neorhizobium lilium]RWX76105.1 potassium channel protein [Neorhizobium lilium]